jgi:hypothetical protein
MSIREVTARGSESVNDSCSSPAVTGSRPARRTVCRSSPSTPAEGSNQQR